MAFSVAAVSAAPALAASGGGGGVAYTPQPKVGALACVKSCAAGKRIQGGSVVRIAGRNLDGVTQVVFDGGPSKVDDQTASVRGRTASSVIATVPVDAQSGPVTLLAGKDVQSDPSKPVRILPAPPPEPNVVLSPVPGSGNGSPPLETATSTSRWFLGEQRAVVFSYRLGGSTPTDVDVTLVRQSDGAVVQTWTQPGVAPGIVQTVKWDGVANDQPQPDGRYAFRVAAHSGSVTASNAAPDDPNRDAFDMHTHIFPVRGRHDFGDAQARFGAQRNGHTHQGQDVMAACGTRLVAAQGGTVLYSGFQSAAGYYLVVHGLDGMDNAYMHMAGPSPFQKDDPIYTGERIGVVGDTGDATACHLHFEVWTAPGWFNGGKVIDPLPYLQAWDAFS